MGKLGYIRGFIIKDKKNVIILLKYINNKPVIRNIAVISTPGRRTYIKHKKLEKFLAKKDSGFLLLSTSRGILTDEESNMFKMRRGFIKNKLKKMQLLKIVNLQNKIT